MRERLGRPARLQGVAFDLILLLPGGLAVRAKDLTDPIDTAAEQGGGQNNVDDIEKAATNSQSLRALVQR